MQNLTYIGSSDNTTRDVSTNTQVCSPEAIAFIVAECISVLLNVVAVAVLSKLKGYRKNTCHLIVRVLVISDSMTATITLVQVSLSCSGFDLRDGVICQIFGYFSTVLLIWSVFIVLLMCTLRYFAVVRPLFYRTQITHRMVRWMLVGQLVWSALHLMLPLVGLGRFKLYTKGQYCAFEIRPHSESAVLVHLTVWEGWLTIFVLIGFTARMVREMRVKKRSTSRLSFQQRRGVKATTSRQQGYTLMTVVIVTIFLICYVPFLVFRTVALISGKVDESKHYFFNLLAHINPMLNPILYVSFNRGYRTAIRGLLVKMCHCFLEPIRTVSHSSSINMSLFSNGAEDGSSSNRSRTSTKTTFLGVPSLQNSIRQPKESQKASTKRRSKRNSIDVSAIGSPTRGLEPYAGFRDGSLSITNLEFPANINDIFEGDTDISCDETNTKMESSPRSTRALKNSQYSSNSPDGNPRLTVTHCGSSGNFRPISSHSNMAQLKSGCPNATSISNYATSDLKSRCLSLSSILYAVDDITVGTLSECDKDDVLTNENVFTIQSNF